MHQKIIGLSLLTVISAVPSFALDGLGIRAEGTNIIVYWPSAGYENFVVQFRETLDSSTPWTTLIFSTPANIPDNFPANGSPFTTYTNFGGVSIPCAGSGASASAGPPGVPMNAATGEAETLAAWEIEGREPNLWELENRPPYPWEIVIATQTGNESRTELNRPESDGPQNDDSNSPCTSTGFYRVFLKPIFGMTTHNTNSIPALNLCQFTSGLMKGWFQM